MEQRAWRKSRKLKAEMGIQDGGAGSIERKDDSS